MIIIHYDYTDGSEVSYFEGMILKDNFKTCCLEFFSTETEANVIVVCQDGRYIDRDRLLKNDGIYTNKEIRKSHNLHKMLIGGSFDFQQAHDERVSNIVAHVK